MYGQGDDNPTGVTGQFNGNVTTAESYDPLTGNAMHSATDILVPGYVGGNPLALTRTMNTRTNLGPQSGYIHYPFGKAGGWRHNFMWEIKDVFQTFNDCQQGHSPYSYVVTYPDGREVTFVYTNTDSGGYYRSATPGISDRFSPLEDWGSTESSCYLLLADGSRINFEVVATFPDCIGGDIGVPPPSFTTSYHFYCSSIVDPYGQALGITRDPTSHRIAAVSEPAGRSLNFYYKPFNGDTVVDYVEEKFDASHTGRRVTYGYAVSASVTALASVDYWGDTSLTASFSYQPSNAGSSNPPLIATCDESMARGPMAKIAYEFAPGQAHGFLSAENNIGGAPVSTLTILNSNTRQEARGDGTFTRTFTYTSGLLSGWTDFKGAPSSQGHLNGFVNSSTDARSNTTDFERNTLLGKIEKITHPQTPSETDHLPAGTPPPLRPFLTRAYFAPSCDSSGDPNNCDSNNPYYLYSSTDERGYPTFFLRDSAKQISAINYPDTSAEGFLYNQFGQVIRHQRKNLNFEHFEYDGRGLLIRAWNPIASGSLPTTGPNTSISYYPVGHAWADRVQTITDPNGHSTTYQYENSGGTPVPGRGLVSKIIDPYQKYRSFLYDRVGRVLHQENELRQPMEYLYDEYGRVKEAKVPHPSENNPAVQEGWETTTYDYTPASGASALSLTANAPTLVITPANVTRKIGYDDNLRATSATQVNSVTGADYATTAFHYDLAGNRDIVTDANSKDTSFEYDQRNRRTKATSPPVDVDGVSGQAPLVTQWFYDPTGNLRLTILPDTKQQSATYDPLNRVLSSTDEMDRTTNYTYKPSGMVHTVEDPNHRTTRFEYNERDLKDTLVYPDTSVLTGWLYDDAGNMKTRPTIGGPKQIFTYDDRNQLKTMRWDNAIDFSDFTYDDAGQMVTAVNPNTSITRQYDVAGRLILDRQTPAAVPNAPPSAVAPVSVVSRKTHGAAGDFDIAMPLSGLPGVESRSGGSNGDYTLVLEFAAPVTAAFATVNSGTGAVSGFSANGNFLTVALTGVSDAQRLTVALAGVTQGPDTGQVVVPMHLLKGDANGSGSVNSTDVSIVSANVGAPVSQANFRSDVNASGAINATDKSITTVAAAVGTSIPALVPPQIQVSYHYQNGRLDRLYVPGTTYDWAYQYDGVGRLEKFLEGVGGPVRHQYQYDLTGLVTQRSNLANGTFQSSLFDAVNRITERKIEAAAYDSIQHLYQFSRETYAYDPNSRLTSTTRDEDDGLRDLFSYNDAGELTGVSYAAQPAPDPDPSPSPSPTPTPTPTPTPGPQVDQVIITSETTTDGDTYIMMSCPTENATIRYTIDHHRYVAPTEDSPVYVDRFRADCTPRYYSAIAYRSDLLPSNVRHFYTDLVCPQSPATTRTVTYTLDAAGNRFEVNANGTVLPYRDPNYNPGANSLNQYGSAENNSVGNGSQHEISAYANVSYRYLADGQLASASSPTAGAYELGYDALGRTVRRTQNGVVTFYAYDGARAILEFNAGGALLTSNVYGMGVDELIARYQNGAWQYFFQDRLGSTRAVANAGGEVIEQYRYEAFGAPTLYSGPTSGWPVTNLTGTPRTGNTTMVNNRVLFTGREWAAQYGFYEYRARAYNPRLGRFMSEDPSGLGGGDTNLFRYCGGDPVNKSDPQGLDPFLQFPAPTPWIDGQLAQERRGAENGAIFNFLVEQANRAMRPNVPPEFYGPPIPSSPGYQVETEFDGECYDENGNRLSSSFDTSFYMGSASGTERVPWEQTPEGRASAAQTALQTGLQNAEAMAWSRFYRPDQIGYTGDDPRGGGNGMLRSLGRARDPFAGASYYNGNPQNDAARRQANLGGPPGIGANLAWQKAGRPSNWWLHGH